MFYASYESQEQDSEPQNANSSFETNVSVYVFSTVSFIHLEDEPNVHLKILRNPYCTPGGMDYVLLETRKWCPMTTGSQTKGLSQYRKGLL